MSHVRIVTNKPVAFDSPDHFQPWGTARDNSTNSAFNKKLMEWMPVSGLRVLDMGCSGGGYVKSILDRSGFAVGIEGSDYSKIRKRAEWATIPDKLFTADITEPFQLFEINEDGQEHPLQFNVITAWEVMEHIREDKLNAVLENISRHLLPNGVIMMSISPNEEIIQGARLHQTVKEKDWWISQFLKSGFKHHEQVLTYFDEDWIRGEDDAPGSFHIVMTRSGEGLPLEERLRLCTLRAQPWNKIKRIVRMPGRMTMKFLRVVTPFSVKQLYDRIRHRER